MTGKPQYVSRKNTSQTIKDFFGKCDQIFRKLWIWLYLQKKSLKENFIFCAMTLNL